MNKTPKRILVVGPGALGIVTAVRLSVAGHNVLVAARSAEKAADLADRGFQVDDPNGQQRVVRLKVVSEAAEIAEPVDLLVVATKCAAAPDAARLWLPVLADTGTFVPYQNGLLGDDFAEIAGNRLVECAVYFPATLIEPGHSWLTGPGHLHLGPWPQGPVRPDSRTARVAGLLADVVATYTYEDIFSVKWNKLVVNAAMTSLGVLSGLEMGGMMRHSVIRKSFLGLVAESLTIAEAAGAKPMSLGGFDAGRVIRLPEFIASIGLRLATRKHGSYKSSSQQSLERGEPTEVGFLNGRIVAEATRLDVAAPWNIETVAAVRAVETNPRLAGVSMVEELLKRVQVIRSPSASVE